MITVRRERGDWDLILITPIPKAHWLELQLTAISWQVWPLVRNLMIGQAVFTWNWLAVWGLTLEVTYLSHVLIFLVCLGFFAFAFGFLPLDGMSRAVKQALTHMARR